MGHRSAVSTRKGGRFYGYKLDMVVCTATDSPVCVERPHRPRQRVDRALPLIDAAKVRGFALETAATDKDYDVAPVHDGMRGAERPADHPAPSHARRSQGRPKPPTCEHGEWRFAGADAKRGATKWRCATGERKPASRWIKADRLHPLIPRETPRWTALYRRRAAVEREFGRLKDYWASHRSASGALSGSGCTPT